MPLAVLLVAEGSGGHLLPAMQVAKQLAHAGATTQLWYTPRPQTAWLADALKDETASGAVQLSQVPTDAGGGWVSRCWKAGRFWRDVQRAFDREAPDVVVGFGGWVSAPVILAARSRRIRCLVHEQNVVPGRANRWLARWVDQVAVSFQETRPMLGRRRCVVTGMPIRERIGGVARAQAAARFTFEAARPTLLVIGGSQGSHALNRVMAQLSGHLSVDERQYWQVIHITGAAEEGMVRQAYQAARMRAWVAPFLLDIEEAYALADVVMARAGASTIAELARCGIPALLIPYPHAGGHQRANARVVEQAGAGIVLEESAAAPSRVLAELRRLLTDAPLRARMGERMRTLDVPDAAQSLARAILSGRGNDGA